MRFTPVAALFTGLILSSAALHAAHDNARHDNDRRDHDRRGHGRGGRVTFYQDVDFRGGSLTLEAGEEIENLTLERFSNGGGANDRISSMRIEGPIEVTVHRDSRFRGATRRFTADVRNLTQDGGQWNDVISSIRTEYRSRRDARDERADVDRAIERVFRDTLGRKPDQSEQRRFRTRMIEENWSDKDVRIELTKTDEYRTVVERIVAKAYRELLGREADPGGLRNYVRHMLQDRWSEEDVRHSMREGEEYLQRVRESDRK
jgi:hypothetical protein